LQRLRRSASRTKHRYIFTIYALDVAEIPAAKLAPAEIEEFIVPHSKKKGADAPVGIKNSWKYEKDLIILNPITGSTTITRLFILLYKH
jgi:hypothetical protein